MDKNYIVMILLVLLVVPMVMGFEYKIDTIKNCEGIVKVADRTTNVQEYSIKGCTKKGDIWECPCSPLPKEIILLYNNEAMNTYSFVIEYYVGDDSKPDNKRTYSHEGLKLKGVKEPEKPKTLPPLNDSSKVMLFIVFGFLGIVILFGIWFVIKKLLSQKDIENTSDYPKEYKEKIISDDDDIAVILKKYQ